MNFDDVLGGDLEPLRYCFKTEVTQVSLRYAELRHNLPDLEMGLNIIML